MQENGPLTEESIEKLRVTGADTPIPQPTPPAPPQKVRVGSGVQPLFANAFSLWGDSSHIRVMACEQVEGLPPSPIHTFLVIPLADAEALGNALLRTAALANPNPPEETDAPQP